MTVAAPKPTSRSARQARDISQPLSRGVIVAIIATGVLSVGAMLKLLAGVITPLLVAVFLFVLVQALGGGMQRRMPKVPGWATKSIAVLLLALAVMTALWIVAEYAASLASQAEGLKPKIEALLNQVTTRFGLAPVDLNQTFRSDEAGAAVAALARSAQSLVGVSGLVVLYLGFLLAVASRFPAKLQSMFGSGESRARRVIDHAANGVVQYVWAQTVTGAVVGLLSWALMASLGLSNAPYLALLIFLASYIPVLGVIFAVALPPLLGLVEFASPWTSLVLLAGLQAINFAVNNIWLPRLQAQDMNLDPVVALVALSLWSLLLGIAGAFLATPLTLFVMALCAEAPGARWFAVLLSSDARPFPQTTDRGARSK